MDSRDIMQGVNESPVPTTTYILNLIGVRALVAIREFRGRDHVRLAR